MPTYRLELSYDGSGFHGYAIQPDVRTVQGEVEAALRRMAGDGVVTSVAGRTDAGVHAVGQVVSFEATKELDTTRLARSLNSLVGPEIAVQSAVRAENGFDARRDAISRRYRYEILNRTVPDPFRRHLTWHVHRKLDVGAMSAAAGMFVGEQDFSSFCRDDEGKSRKRYVIEASWSRQPDDIVAFDIEANAFCHQMVRSLVALCVEVGKGNRTVEAVAAVMEGRDRNLASGAAPPQGLKLVSVSYEGERWHP